jgi:hypothetical protein
LRIRKIAGGILVSIGAGLTLLGLYNLNNFLFLGNMTDLKTLPQYLSFVILPILIGSTFMIDGGGVWKLHSILSIIPYAGGNAALIFASYNLSLALNIPVINAHAYQQVFVEFGIAALLLIVGTIVNSITGKARPRKKTRMARVLQALNELPQGGELNVS